MPPLPFLWLTDAQAQQIVRHARDEAPCEACGVIIGRAGQVTAVVPIPNVAFHPHHHYHMDERALVNAMMEAQRNGLELLAFYHSHPVSEPLPSHEDIRLAAYPDTPYLIVGLANGEGRLAAWRIRYGQVERVTLHIGLMPPEVDTSTELSAAGKTAILVSALLAFIVMIALSLSLLPPAPRITP